MSEPAYVLIEQSRWQWIEDTLRTLLDIKVGQDFYSTQDLAKILNRDPFTVRNWCRQGRVNAEKRPGGRGGGAKEWMVSHAELERLKSQGLLPIRGESQP